MVVNWEKICCRDLDKVELVEVQNILQHASRCLIDFLVIVNKDRHARTLKDTQTDEQEYSIFAIVKPHYIQCYF